VKSNIVKIVIRESIYNNYLTSICDHYNEHIYIILLSAMD